MNRAEIPICGPLLMLYPADLPGGPFTLVENLIEALINKGVIVYLGLVNGKSLSLINKNTGKSYNIRRSKSWVIDIVNLSNYVKDNKIKLIHSHLNTYILAAVTAKYSGIQSIRTIHGRLNRPGMLSLRERIPFWLAIFLLGQKVIAVSTPVAAELKNYYRLREEENLFIIQNGSKPVNINTITSKFRKHDEVVFAFVGRFEEAKGFIELINVFKVVHNLYPTTRLLLVGDGDKKNIVNKNLVSSGVITLSNGWLTKEKVLETLHTNADIFVLPSHSEGFSIALLEAMSLGLVPIISSNADPGDLIEQGINGFVVETSSEIDLLDKMITLVNNKDKLKKLGYEAKITVDRKFNLEIFTEKHIDLYNKLLNLESNRLSHGTS